MNISILYFTTTGNTEELAKLIAENYQKENCYMSSFSQLDDTIWKNSDIIFLGTPAQGTEEVDNEEFLPFIENNIDILLTKKIVFFGSFGWGGGEYLVNFADTCKENGLNIVCVITQEENPDSQTAGEVKEILNEHNLN